MSKGTTITIGPPADPVTAYALVKDLQGQGHLAEGMAEGFLAALTQAGLIGPAMDSGLAQGMAEAKNIGASLANVKNTTPGQEPTVSTIHADVSVALNKSTDKSIT